jgi:hypothetical protein
LAAARLQKLRQRRHSRLRAALVALQHSLRALEHPVSARATPALNRNLFGAHNPHARLLSPSPANHSQADCSLPEGHAYRQACGLRPGSSGSLVALTFASHPPSHSDPRVPPGLAFYTLQAKLSELQVVFLYRFLQHNLQYIATLLAMRPPPLAPEALAPPAPAASPAPQVARTPSARGEGRSPSPAPQTPPQPQQKHVEEQAAAPAQQQPFVLVMDVSASAPVICMPRTSRSADAIEVDLGELRLTSTVTASSSQLLKGGQLLVEAAVLTFSGVGLAVVQAGRRGASVVRNPEQGWRLRWRRPLEAARRGDDPGVSPSLRGCVLIVCSCFQSMPTDDLLLLNFCARWPAHPVSN